jgi:hydroxymethylpyrimidine/phosphomethylpyrimidine kinase
MPEVCVITPNIDEAGELVGWPVITTADMAGAAAQLISRGAKYVVITGGRLAGDESIDAIWTDGGVRFLHAPRQDTLNVRGTGSTFSAAIAAQLALGATMIEAVTSAKSYVTAALTGSRDWQVGYHHRPLDNLCVAFAPAPPLSRRKPMDALPASATAFSAFAAAPASGQPALPGPIGPRSGVPLPAGNP